jgi:hypothetical protein
MASRGPVPLHHTTDHIIDGVDGVDDVDDVDNVDDRVVEPRGGRSGRFAGIVSWNSIGNLSRHRQSVVGRQGGVLQMRDSHREGGCRRG